MLVKPVRTGTAIAVGRGFMVEQARSDQNHTGLSTGHPLMSGYNQSIKGTLFIEVLGGLFNV
jgi:hypothetical protein